MKSMYRMTKSGELFSDEPTNLMINEAGFKQAKYQMPVHDKFSPYGFKLVMLPYVYACVYWYTYKELGKLFVDTLGNLLHMQFL